MSIRAASPSGAENILRLTDVSLLCAVGGLLEDSTLVPQMAASGLTSCLLEFPPPLVTISCVRAIRAREC